MVNLLPKDISLSKIINFTFNFAGVMDLANKKTFSFHLALVLINAFISIISSTAELFLGRQDTENLVETFSVVVVCILALLYTFLFIIKRKEIRNLFERLEIIRLNILQDEENKQFIIEAENIGKKIYPALFISLPCYPLSSLVLNSISEVMTSFKKKFIIFRYYIPWSTEDIWIHLLSNALGTLITFIFLSVYLAMYTMEITFTLYTTAYIKSLEHKLINKGINSEDAIEHHNDINQLIYDYIEIRSLLLYMQTVIAPLMPCGFVASSFRALQRNDISKSFESILRSILCLTPCLVSCCCGQVIITEMERLHEASYMSNWYEQNPKVRKDFLQLMTRTTRIASVNYRLFIRFDHILLNKILQVIYSYTMLMVNLD